MLRATRRYVWATTVLAGSAAAVPAMAATISGSVNDASGERALGGAEVEIVELGRTARTDADGSFRFTDVPAGHYTLLTRYSAAAASQDEVDVRADGTASVTVNVGSQSSRSDLEEVLVTGQRAMLASSLSRQRQSDTIESVLTRDAIGQFPDQNVAEAARRLTGINVLNDQGEGRFIAVRGLDPSLNAASVNGTRLPAPEADTRAVALDVIPSELVESIEVKKTLTPDMDADTIGASIQINTTSAFDLEEPFVAATGEWSYNDLNEKGSQKTSVDFSYPFSDRFGIAGGVSYNKRKTSTDNTEMDGWNETDDGLVYAEELEYRDYDVLRERSGASLSFDFRPTDTTTLYARTLYSQFDDEEQRRRLIFAVEEPASGDMSTATFLSDDDRIRVRRDLKDRFESQEIQSFEIGGDSLAGPWTFDYKAAYSKASEHEFRTQDPTRFQRDFEEPGELAVMFDYSDLHTTTYDVLAGEGAFLDAAGYELTAMEQVDGLSEDEETALQLDIARDLDVANGEFQLKFGAKARSREKFNDVRLDVFDDFDGTYTLANVLGSQTFNLAVMDPIPDRRAVRAFNGQNASSFELNVLDTAFESNVANYRVKEDVDAAYVMGRWDTGRTILIGGVRMERTNDDVTGNLVELVEEGGTRDGVVLDEDTLFVTPTALENSYTHWLPSASLRFEVTNDLLFRAGLFKSVVRPKISALPPRFIVEENDEGEREGEFGNPDLKPYEATNLDLSAEWYFADNAVLQGGLFHKTIDNFIVDASFEAGDAPFFGTFNGIGFDEAVIPLNGEEATVTGFELNYQQALANGVLLGFNYTYTDAEGDIAGRTVPLPAASKNNFNVMAGYENNRVSIRLTAAYRDEYLDELGGSAEEDRYVKDHLQWDLSAKYLITDQIRLYAEFVNLGDEPYVAFQRGPGRDRLLQYETYSWTGKLGVKVSF